MPPVPTPEDIAYVLCYAAEHDGVHSVQITGGSTFRGEKEKAYITSYLEAINASVGRERLSGEILLYITPPDQHETVDRYMELGVDRIACSLEVWDDALAAEITPGKRAFTTKERHLDILSYLAGTYGEGRAFSNFIIGLEPLESLREGAVWMGERGIIPSASVWMPFGKPVRGSMRPPELDYYRRVKEMLAEVYSRYALHPAGCCGLNVCIERDIDRMVTGKECCGNCAECPTGHSGWERTEGEGKDHEPTVSGTDPG